MNQYVISSLEQQWRKDPTSRVFFRLAEEYRKGGAFEKAIEILRVGIQHHPRYLPARVCLGRCHQALGKSDQALSDFLEIIKVAPDNSHALSGLASIYFDSDQLEEALAHYETLAIHEPFDSVATNRILEIKDKMADRELETAAILGESSESSGLGTSELDTLSPDGPGPLDESEEDQASHVFEETDVDLVEDVEEPGGSQESYSAFLSESARDDSLDPLDVEFDKAVALDEDVSLFIDLNPEVASGDSPDDVVHPMSVDEEKMLTDGLKHEKMEHYEAAYHIYSDLLETRSGDPSVQQHLQRLKQMMDNESGNRKKIRLLSNWLDKIKGVYYVS